MDKAEQRRLEREKRQARIKASSTNRLSKITGVAGTQDYKEPVNVDMVKAIKEATPPAASPEPESPFQTLMKSAQTESAPVNNVKEQPSKQSFKLPEIYFQTAHFLVALLVGLYSALNNPYAIVSVFVLAEALLFSAHLLIGQPGFQFSDIPLVSPFLAMLPPNRKSQLKSALVVLKTARNAYYDFAVVVFVYGIASWGGRQFRPFSNYACSSC